MEPWGTPGPNVAGERPAGRGQKEGWGPPPSPLPMERCSYLEGGDRTLRRSRARGGLERGQPSSRSGADGTLLGSPGSNVAAGRGGWVGRWMKGNGGNPAAPASVITSKPKGGRVGGGQQEFLLPPPPIFNQTALPTHNPGLIYSLTDATVSSSSVLVQTLPGSFPDIYDGDTKKWEEHFHSIQRAYKEFGKDDDFAIRVLTEDFTLPFPFTWPDEGEASLQPSDDPTDCSSFDFFLHPGKPVPRILQPLHATTQAFFKKRRLEQLALSYASQASQGPPAQAATPPMRTDVVMITSLPHVSTSTIPGDPTFLLKDGEGLRNIQPAPVAVSNPAPPRLGNPGFLTPTISRLNLQ
ncbi:uncharacterized protein C8orf90 homolog [Malaclemys terrapin pileata]|uniref:uncharacterized protein C8orf90 homolog n=1 Tax=Malaclemys terrapin pileata TaxID=2991368 RepID=UPI0023A8D82D|nr:uncharacterized protein C8orf90 homolog [Malaclemys terrapin pileata]